jgi:hypothetical protein
MRVDKNQKNIKKWLSEAEDKTLALPEFQRYIVWDPQKCASLLEAIINDNPVGIFLLLQINPDKPPFDVRFIEGADEASGVKPTILLLDGQQRITSLFRAFSRKDKQAEYYIKFNITSNQSISFNGIQAIKRISKEANIIGNASEEFEKNYIPVSILNPLADSDDLMNVWIQEGIDDAVKSIMFKFCRDIRKKLRETHIPHFQLPQDTDQAAAIDIYLKLNTQSVTLSAFYEAVGLMYSQTNPRRSLLQIIKELKSKVPSIKQMESTDPDNLFMKIACLKQNRAPTDGVYKKLDFKKVYNDRTDIIRGAEWATEKMNLLGINKGKQLPSSVPLRVLPAIHKLVSTQSPSAKGAAHKIINKYIWHAFLTPRYEKSANTILKKDYDDLIKSLTAQPIKEEMEIFKLFNRSKADIEKADWPGKKTIFGKGILLACQLNGAVDVETDARLSFPEESDWNLDHIFPKKRLLNIGLDPNRALNCMLLNPGTNKRFSDSLPGTRIRKMQARIAKASGSIISLSEIKKRYEKQLVSSSAFNLLLTLNDEKISDKDLETAYNKFLKLRATSVKRRVDKLLDEGKI